MLNQKTEDLAEELKISDFKVTNGWLCMWKERNHSKQTHGESSCADTFSVNH